MNVAGRRIFSGIQPTGVPHIGNYLGAIRNWVNLQNNASRNDLIIFCVVDQHSCTTHQDPVQLKENVTNMVAFLLACGINPNKSLLFQQSKSKSGNEKENSNLGLFSYPVLMAADILLYKSTHVPVGHDQLQHIELTRDLTNLFNKRYNNDVFPLPESILTDTARIMSLRKPQEKMSKSDKMVNSRIDLTDSDDTIALKIRKAVTDSNSFLTHGLNERHGVRNLIDILSALTDTDKSTLIERYGGIEYFTRNLKSDTTDALIEHLKPIRNRYEDIISDRAYLNDILRNGSEKAKEIAEETMSDVHKVLGMSL
uniref:tryptophan--tRNA ligase n=1 Tax=Clytia hemisphaerica TaxID=252671 RepID=A0A7M6DNN7_9CNID